MNVLLLKAWLAENAGCLLGTRLREVRQVDAKSLALQLGGQWVLVSILEAFPTLAILDAENESLLREVPESRFVKALGHQLSGAILQSIVQEGFDRSIVFSFSRKDIYGRETLRWLRVELVGRASNAYLLSDKGLVISIFKHVPPGRNSVRRVVTGKPLPPPPPLGKYVAAERNLTELGTELTRAQAANPQEAMRELLTRHVAGGDVSLWPRLAEVVPLDPGLQQLQHFICNLQAGKYNPQLFDLASNTANKVALDAWLQAATGQGHAQVGQQQPQLAPREAQISRQLKIALRAEELENAGLEMLQRAIGFESRERESAYLKGWKISHAVWAERIDIEKSAEENAGALIEYAQRLKRARPKLEKLVAEFEEKTAAGSSNDVDSGDRLDEQSISGPAISSPQPDPLSRDLEKLERNGIKYLRYVTSDGIAVIVGQSDRSNDELVRHYGSSRHLWLHVRDYPGSHVLLLTGGRDAPQRSLEEAAIIAGYYSKGRGESDLDISYTPVKQLRRPRGGKPGQVLLVSEKVIRVNPMRFEALRDALRVNSTSQ